MIRELIKFNGWKLPALAVIGLCLALLSVMSRPETVDKKPIGVPPKSSYEKNIAGIGIVEPVSGFIAVGVELPGIVREIRVHVGQMVKKGEILYVLDQRDIDAQIATLKSNLSSAKVQMETAKAAFDIVRHLENDPAVAKDDFNNRKFAYLTSLANVDVIKSQLEQAYTTKARLNVIAPLDGMVLEVNVHLGEFATAGEVSIPLIRMGGVSDLRVRVEVDEEFLNRINPKVEAYGTFRDDPTTKIPLVFSHFESYVRPKTNLVVANQRVDTRVVQALYLLPRTIKPKFVGQQMDVYIKDTVQVPL